MMYNRGIFVGLAIALVLSLGANAYLFIVVQRAPEVIYVEKPAPEAEDADTKEAPPVVVHISGAVNRPSVYTLPAGSRVVGALEAAGGALPGADLNRINLARLLSDGEQVHIYLEGDVGSPAVPVVGTVPTTPASTSLININTATQAELETLPGIGAVKASDIITYRTQNGPFRQIEDMMNVKGIGEKTFESLKSLIRVR